MNLFREDLVNFFDDFHLKKISKKCLEISNKAYQVNNGNIPKLNPTINIEWLQNEYDITNYIKNNFDKLEFLRREFINFYDIEKYLIKYNYRLVAMKRMYFESIYEGYMFGTEVMYISE